MENFIWPLIGGILIGLSSSTMLAGIGRITGISGIFSGVLRAPKKENIWQLTFILGLLAGGVLMILMRPELFNYGGGFNKTQAVIAGLLVGFGTRLGSGCTSGHGVCGLPRLSERSLVATLVFIGCGVITVFIRKMVWGL
ncbi:MAG: YeeE/YedE family protein [Bacteriovoracaceae bacterium]